MSIDHRVVALIQNFFKHNSESKNTYIEIDDIIINIREMINTTCLYYFTFEVQ